MDQVCLKSVHIYSALVAATNSSEALGLFAVGAGLSCVQFEFSPCVFSVGFFFIP